MSWLKRLLIKLRLARTAAEDPSKIPTIVRAEREIAKAGKK
jgi:hypothetical protein